MNKHIIGAFGISILVVALHIIASRYRLYFIFNWFDTLLHILGGIAIGFFSLGVNRYVKTTPIAFASILGGIIGIAWEMFERIGHSYLPMYIGFGGIGDTILDIICAILGALLIVAISKQTYS